MRKSIIERQYTDNNKVSVEIDGQTYDGHYFTETGVVTVSTLYGEKSTQTGASSLATARMLLRELVQAELQRKDSMLK